jgi:hypothetical protein
MAIGFCAFVYVCIIAEKMPGLSWINLKMQELDKKYQHFHILYDPIMGCEVCNAGQLALWWCVYHEIGLQTSVLTICVSIYTAFLFKATYLWIKRKG